VGGAFLVESSLALAWMGKTTRAGAQLSEVVEATRLVAPAIASRALVAAAAAAVDGGQCDVGWLLDAAAALEPSDLAHIAGVRTLQALVADDVDAAHSAWSAPETDPGMAGVAETQWSWVERMIPLVDLVTGGAPTPPGARW